MSIQISSVYINVLMPTFCDINIALWAWFAETFWISVKRARDEKYYTRITKDALPRLAYRIDIHAFLSS